MLGIPDLVRVLSIVSWRKRFEPPTFSSDEHSFTGRELVWGRGDVVLRLSGNAQAEAWNNATVILTGNAQCIAHDSVHVIAEGNSQAQLLDQAEGTVRGNAELWCYGLSRATAWGGYLHLYGNAQARVSHVTLDAWDDSKVYLLAHSIIRASDRVIITQGPFVDTSDVVCDREAKLVGVPRLGDGTKKFAVEAVSPKASSGR